MLKIKLLILTLSCLILSGCVMDDDEVDSTITISNKSDKAVNMYFIHVSENNPAQFPEIKPELALIPPHSAHKFKSEFIKFLKYPNRFLYIYIFDKEEIDSIAWQEIIKNNMHLYRYDLSLQDLKDKNWQIVYPVKN